jgi:hypothetical protein
MQTVLTLMTGWAAVLVTVKADDCNAPQHALLGFLVASVLAID